MPHTLVVVGGGVIGLGIAWRCAQRGVHVTVMDAAPGRGASAAAAGMLAPVTELHYGEQELLGLNLASARRYPDFVAELEDATGQNVGYRRTGTVVAAWDTADVIGLRDLQTFGASVGVRSQLLSARELRRLEPGLASGLPGGLFAQDDHQVDNRALHAALRTAATRCGVHIELSNAASLLLAGERVTGVTASGRERHNADHVVLAAGAWSGRLAGLTPQIRPPVRPVKGQTVRLRLPDPPALAHVVRGSVKGSPVYLVPRTNGEIVVGASSEEVGFDVRPRAGAMYELLRDAQSLVPVVGEAEFVEVSTSVRPGSPDNAPIIGRAAIDGLIMATGHYRNGILLTPITADAVASLVCDNVLPEVVEPFTPARFEQIRITA
jgi:glycine oxidase